MTEITAKEEPEQDFELPLYSDVGRILVEVLSIDELNKAYFKYEIEVLDYDSDSSVFWISEGIGFEYWMDQYCDFTSLGVYVIEGIRGEYFKGDWGFTDDDEEWEFESIRPATEEEIKTQTLP